MFQSSNTLKNLEYLKENLLKKKNKFSQKIRAFERSKGDLYISDGRLM